MIFEYWQNILANQWNWSPLLLLMLFIPLILFNHVLSRYLGFFACIINLAENSKVFKCTAGSLVQEK